MVTSFAAARGAVWMEMSSFNRLSIWLELVFHFVFGAAGCLLSEGGKHSTFDISLAEKEIASVSAGTQVNMYMLICR